MFQISMPEEILISAGGELLGAPAWPAEATKISIPPGKLQ
jgi:hypothetical protein